jgi:plastocyanin
MANLIKRSITIAIALALAAPVAGYDGAAVSGGGTISGVVKYKGTAPAAAPLDVNKDKEVCATKPKLSKELVVGADGGIQYAVVSIATIAKGKPFETAKPVVDQKGCEYLPHVTLVPAGQEFDITNDDGILHNIHTYSAKNPVLNRAQPKFKKTLTEKLAQPERVKLTCDVHGWMTGWVVVMDHPYYATTDDKGSFKLTDVPPGDYELKVWQEKLGETTQKVTVQGGQETKVTFELAGK